MSDKQFDELYESAAAGRITPQDYKREKERLERRAGYEEGGFVTQSDFTYRIYNNVGIVAQAEPDLVGAEPVNYLRPSDRASRASRFGRLYRMGNHDLG